MPCCAQTGSGDLAVSVLLGLAEKGSFLCLGGSVGKFIHSTCPESWVAAPSPWRPPGLCSQWSLQENTGPHLSLYCANCWGHFEMGLTLQKGPCTACSDVRGEGGGCWVAPSLLPSVQHQPVMAFMVCSVSPTWSSHGCSFLLILLQCQSLLAWQQPLHLSAVLWPEHNQNPCEMGSFPVSELFGYVNNVVRMSVKYEKGFLQDIELTF